MSSKKSKKRSTKVRSTIREQRIGLRNYEVKSTPPNNNYKNKPKKSFSGSSGAVGGTSNRKLRRQKQRSG